MNIVMNIDNIDNNNIFLANEIKNTIINEGVFYKLNYSNHILTLTNLLIKLEIPEYTIFQNYFKYKCAFRAEKYTDFINKITALEYSILYKIYPNNKRIYRRANANISRLLQSGSFKLTQQPLEKTSTITLKISGIWETDESYGLTYKFIFLSK
jgi:hypothetical protein